MRSSKLILWAITATVYILLISSVRAEIATETEARQVCNNWLIFEVYHYDDWSNAPNPEVREVISIIANDTLLGWCFNIEPEGYIIVPALKDLPPVKASSDIGSLDDFSGKYGVAAMMRDVLLHRVRLFALRYGDIDYTSYDKDEPLFGSEHRLQWDYFLQDEEAFRSRIIRDKADPQQIGPLLTTY